jgi:HSP20 family protein
MKTLLVLILSLWAVSNAFADNKTDSYVPVSRQPGSATIPSLEEPTADPFQEMEKMQEGFNQIFRESWKRMKNYQQAGKFFEPDADFVEKQGNYVLTMDLPGMQKDQINIEAAGNYIAVSGERKTERQINPDNEGAYQFERSSGSFYRRMTLPSDADTEKIGAKYENGVLEVTIPKTTPENVEKKKIAIQ